MDHERVPLVKERRATTVAAARSARLRKERDAFNEKQPWHSIPRGPLIMIADAIVKYRKGVWHTWFFMLVRPVDGEDAVILPPYHAQGREVCTEWLNAFETVSPNVLKRVKALVSDGHRGLTSEATWRGWLIQRCHIHLIMAIQARRSRWAMSRLQSEGVEIHALTNCILNNPCQKKADQALARIEEIGWSSWKAPTHVP